MVDPKLMEAWYRLMAEAARSGADPWSPLHEEGDAPKNPAAWLARWMKEQGATSDLPGSMPDPDEMPEAWMEQWYRSMGVVPRSRYLRALERNEKLRNELEKAKERIERLSRASKQGADHAAAADDMLDQWQQSLEDTLDAQARWMESFTRQSKASQSDDAPEDDSADAPDDRS